MTGLELAQLIKVAVTMARRRFRTSDPVERGGVIEPGASFDVTDEEGHTWRVIVARQT